MNVEQLFAKIGRLTMLHEMAEAAIAERDAQIAQLQEREKGLTAALKAVSQVNTATPPPNTAAPSES